MLEQERKGTDFPATPTSIFFSSFPEYNHMFSMTYLENIRKYIENYLKHPQSYQLSADVLCIAIPWLPR